MANIVEVILKATDQTGSTFSKLNSSFQSLTGFSLSAAGGVAMAGVAIGKAVEYTKQAIEANDKYVSSIVDMARFTGDQTDAMSRLVQVADDAFLSQEQLNNAMSIGAKKGLDMSVEGIKKLADEYNALATPQERATLLNDNFGRSGLAMGKLLEQGAAGIQKNMNAIADNLVVTDKSVKVTYDYKKSVDALNDSLDGVKYTIAQQTMPVLTDLNTVMSYLIDKTDNLDVKNKNLVNTLGLLFAPVIELGIKYIDLWVWGLGKAADAINGTGDASVVAADRYDKMNSSILLATGAMNENKESADKLTASFKPLTNEIIFNTLASSLDAEGQLTLARHLGLIDEAAYNAGLKLAGLTEQFDLNANGLIDPIEQTDAYWAAIKRVTDTAGTYYWNYVVTTNSQVAPAPPSSTGGMTGYVQPTRVVSPTNYSAASTAASYVNQHRASGGDVYAGQAYWVGEQGPEPFIPKQNGTIISNKNASSLGISKQDMQAAFTDAMAPMMSFLTSEFAKRS